MSPRTKEQNEEIRRQRKQEILQAAILVYADKGYSATEVGDIAAKAGLARGLVYHYFENKQALFRELYEHMMGKTKRTTVSHFEQKGSALELLSEYARLVCRKVLEEPAISRFYMRISLDIHFLYTEEQFSSFEWVKDFIQPMTSTIEKGMKQGTIRQGNPSLIAMQFWGAISQGMNYLGQLQQELHKNETSEQEIKDQLMVVLEQVTETALAIVIPE
ncbi:TetR/AcrR family transcriptional regulator [Niallia sp. 01092]|uniref:TetR/AcrR family transcriptional regulator n=1 Tax=unclassified Niallia TaxID=2837522 RepID=UPI003FD18A0E